MSNDGLEYVKPTKIRKDRKTHFHKQRFDDDEPNTMKKAGKKQHGRMFPDNDCELDYDDEHPYANFDDWKKYLK
jgi:hypothetical protein